jgi:hypothetical protein
LFINQTLDVKYKYVHAMQPRPSPGHSVISTLLITSLLNDPAHAILALKQHVSRFMLTFMKISKMYLKTLDQPVLDMVRVRIYFYKSYVPSNRALKSFTGFHGHLATSCGLF